MSGRIIIIIFFFISVVANGQKKQPIINYSLNRIQCANIEGFFQKLELLEKTRQGMVSVVQIGDSHTQPDFFSSVLRNSLQKQFGNAGRGIVFPYSLAGSNSPSDIKSKSKNIWLFNRIAHPELGTNSGLAGFIIFNNDSSGNIDIVLDNNSEADSSAVSLLLEKSKGCKFEIILNDDSSNTVKNKDNIDCKAPVKKISFRFENNDSIIQFYGVDIRQKQPGVVYHNIGVNGARYDQFNITPRFWNDLPRLSADLFIVSLGTNEAQKDSFNKVAFLEQVDIFINKLRSASPGASIIITTTMDSYKRSRPNETLKQINMALKEYCLRKKIALWDLYGISNGYGSSRQWIKAGLMSRDRIHYLREGYLLQGELFNQCILKEYRSFKN